PSQTGETDTDTKPETGLRADRRQSSAPSISRRDPLRFTARLFQRNRPEADTLSNVEARRLLADSAQTGAPAWTSYSPIVERLLSTKSNAHVRKSSLRASAW
ncbi:MAG TPA: hypothetical protein VFP60_18130, partial [Pseudolabrys sp.]|nr:hypothetical protein [Pseudolabrys sp.]